MPLIITNMLIDSRNTMFRAFKQLEKVGAIEQQNLGDIRLTVFEIRRGDHFLQHAKGNVIADMAAVNKGCEHELSQRALYLPQ